MSQSVLLAPHSDHRNPPVTCLAFNNQLTPRVALPSAPSAHRQIPIAEHLARRARPTRPNRGFVPWRFSYAGRRRLWRGSRRPASENLHITRTPCQRSHVSFRQHRTCLPYWLGPLSARTPTSRGPPGALPIGHRPPDRDMPFGQDAVRSSNSGGTCGSSSKAAGFRHAPWREL